METQTQSDPPIVLSRLVRRCEIYNEINGTEYTPETYDAERTRVPRMIEWDQGWEACESTAHRLLAEIVRQYDVAPDGPLGKGFTNGPFLAAPTHDQVL
jgi:hypothetical protein